MTNAWLGAGFETEAVDLEQRRLVFRRKHPAPPGGGPGLSKPPRHPILGCMKGTMTMAPDFDPTAPADPEWGARAYGETK
jgi:hypothetical protein